MDPHPTTLRSLLLSRGRAWAVASGRPASGGSARSHAHRGPSQIEIEVEVELSAEAEQLLDVLARHGIRAAEHLVVGDLFRGGRADREGQDVLLDSANAYLGQQQQQQGLGAATGAFDDAHHLILSTFLERLASLRELAIQALSPPVQRGSEALLSGMHIQQTTATAPENLMAMQECSAVPAFALPTAISKLLMAGLPNDMQDASSLCVPQEVVQVAGTKASGRKTLVLNALMRSLCAHTATRALWIGVPLRSSQPLAEAELHKRAEAARLHVAAKALHICDALLGESARTDAAGEDEEKAQRAVKRQKIAEEYDPLDRLGIETCTNVDGIIELVDALLTSPPALPADPLKAAAYSQSSSLPIQAIVIDQVQRLFNDEEALQLLPGMTKTSVQADLQHLCRHMVRVARTASVRVYLINSALASLPYNPLSSFGNNKNCPSLGASFSHMLDASLWVSRGNAVFTHVSPSSASAFAAAHLATSAGVSKCGAEAFEHEVRAAAASAAAPLRSGSDAATDASEAECQLVSAIAEQGPGMRTHILEVLESSRGGKGRWTTYSSDGTRLLDSPALL